VPARAPRSQSHNRIAAPQDPGRSWTGPPRPDRPVLPHKTPRNPGASFISAWGSLRRSGSRAATPSTVDILIVRDPKEPTKKCSLTPLRGMAGLRFVSVRGSLRVEAGRRLWLHPEGELLSAADRGGDLLLIDCSWRKLPAMAKHVDGELLRRRLPPLVTAYPRRSKVAEDPAQGLASVEALYAAVAILEGPRPELLGKYRWAEAFLAANPELARA
jgi:pre-rRNA-processing protein TSR3